jgi:hypothetical protein
MIGTPSMAVPTPSCWFERTKGKMLHVWFPGAEKPVTFKSSAMAFFAAFDLRSACRLPSLSACK